MIIYHNKIHHYIPDQLSIEEKVNFFISKLNITFISPLDRNKIFYKIKHLEELQQSS